MQKVSAKKKKPIVKTLKEKITTLVEIKFLIGVTSLFNVYLQMPYVMDAMDTDVLKISKIGWC